MTEHNFPMCGGPGICYQCTDAANECEDCEILLTKLKCVESHEARINELEKKIEELEDMISVGNATTIGDIAKRK